MKQNWQIKWNINSELVAWFMWSEYNRWRVILHKCTFNSITYDCITILMFDRKMATFCRCQIWIYQTVYFNVIVIILFRIDSFSIENTFRLKIKFFAESTNDIFKTKNMKMKKINKMKHIIFSAINKRKCLFHKIAKFAM